MKDFTLSLQDSKGIETVPGVTSFLGRDASGSFGILADHARFMTALVTGLAAFRTGEDEWHYLAVPGAILSFDSNQLSLSTRHCLRDDDYMRISQALKQQLLAEEKRLLSTRQSLHNMEQEVLKRLWDMARGEGR